MMPLIGEGLDFGFYYFKQQFKASLEQFYICKLQSNQVKRTPQEYITEFIIQKLNPLLVVDFRLMSAFLHV